MSSKREAQAQMGDDNEHRVFEFLRQNPDFLVKHPELLDTLAIPHDQSGASSLIEHQVSVLQDKNRRLTRQMREYHEVAQSNHDLLEKLHDLYLIMLHAKTARDLLDNTIRAIDREFMCDAVVIGLFVQSEDFDHPSCVNLGTGAAADQFEPLSKQTEPICGRLKKSRLEILFGEQSSKMRSAALAPLSEQKALGFLALGSHDEHKYHPGMGTLFLSLLGQMLGNCLEAWLAPHTTEHDD